MEYGDIIGYLASALVFATFYVRTMMPLRMLAIAQQHCIHCLCRK